MDTFWQDVRFAFRSLRQSPGFAVVAVLTLALGVGATTALFSVVDGVLLKPFPYPQPERLMVVQEANPSRGFPRFATSPPNWIDFRDRSRSFASMAAFTGASFNLTGDGEPERLQGRLATHELFTVIGIKPVHGRDFLPSDDVPGAPRVAILTNELFQRRFGGDPSIVGRTLTLDGEPVEVVGVMPAQYTTTSHEILAPLRLDVAKTSRGGHYLGIYARLADGVTVEQARSEMQGIAAGLAQEYPDSNTGWTAIVDPLGERVVESVRPALLVLLGAVVAVLLIACANVANLFLARLASREREVALRTAIGAGRGRLVRQLLTESGLLALVGGGLGVLIAMRATKVLVAMAGDLPRAEEVAVDSRVLGFALAISLATGLLFGLLPAFRASRVDLAGTLKESGRGQAGDPRGHRLRRGLVLVEVALAFVLLVCAGLLLQSLDKLLAVDPGFEPQGALTARLQLPAGTYADEDSQAAFYRTLLGRLEGLPGVSAAGAIYPMPLGRGRYILTFEVEGREPARAGEEVSANVRFASPGYFAAMDVPLRRGRLFDDRDERTTTPVAVVSETTASRFFPGEDPIDKRITFGDPSDPETTWMTLVGVVGDVHHDDVSEAPGPEIYLSLIQSPVDEANVVLRTAGSDPTVLAGPLRAEVRAVDPLLPVSELQPVTRLVEASLAGSRFNSVLLGLFAVLALALSAIGLYGVVSLSVGQRRREIGVRRALGAPAGQVLGLVFRQGLAPVVGGVVLGLLGAAFATRAVSSFVYGVDVFDIPTFAAVPVVLLVVAALACVVPALRAIRIDPVVVLREE